MFTRVIERLTGAVNCCPWQGHAYGMNQGESLRHPTRRTPYLYTPEERRRRDSTKWTLVQGILAPLQFLVFLISAGLVLHYLAAGTGFEIATISVLVKTALLLTIMVTGAVWEKKVFGQYLFARAFFWEDVFSMLVVALHATYVTLLITGWASPRAQMLIALAAYAAYLINATQFVMKLRAARLEAPQSSLGHIA